MKVLVTGGAGFIGSHIVDALIAQGHSVAIVDNLSTGTSANLNSNARLHQADVTDIDAMRRVFDEERPQLVSHHAAQVDVRRSMAEPEVDAAVNVLGTVNLAHLSVEYGVERLIYPSTCAVYAEPVRFPMDEEHPKGPQSAYGASKYAAEQYLGFFGRVHGLRHKIFRYGNVFGPRQNPKGEAGVVAIFTGQLLGGMRPTIFGDGAKTRDYVYVRDIVRANVMGMGESGDGQVFNLASGMEVSDLQVFEAVRAAVGVKVSPLYADKRPGEADRVALDVSRAREVLGWTSSASFREGVQRTVDYLR